MRLLAPLILLLAPAPALAQAPTMPPELAEVTRWSQQILAAQKPMIDAYARCTPTVQAIMTQLKLPPEQRGWSDQLKQNMATCIAESQDAGAKAVVSLKAMPPMPARFEQALRIDSRKILNGSAAAMQGMNRYLGLVDEMLRAAHAGDEALVRRKGIEARASAGSASDAQIVILESMRAAMPMPVHKAMLDLRLGLARAGRAIMVHDEEAGWPALGDALQAEAGRVGAAAAQVRSSWTAQRAAMKPMLDRADPRLSHAFTVFDRAWTRIAAEGDAFVTIVRKIPPASLDEAEALRILDAAARAEIRMLEAANMMTTAFQQD